jgi:hypothetical protein
MSEERNCAFQYAEMTRGFGRTTKIVEDKFGLTLKECHELWSKYYPQAAKHIKDNGEVEMVVWINMVDSHSYGEYEQYISTDAESDGNTIWVTEKKLFPKEIKQATA